MKSNLEIIKEKVIEVVPEILELKFGCKVSIIPEIDGEREEIVIDNGYEVNTAGKGNLYQKETGNVERIYEIIGRPIQLSDVLRAMQSLQQDNPNRHWVVNRYGEFLNDAEGISPLKGFSKVGPMWDLSKPLEEQSEEVLEFLVRLLDNK